MDTAPISMDELQKRIKINPETGCWEWQGALSGRRYGSIRRQGKTLRVHRLSYELYKGTIPAGFCIRHSCDNPKCCNPDHLCTGTQLENMADLYSRGRQNPPRGDRNAMKLNSLKGEKNGRAKLTDSDIPKIRQLLSEGKTKSEIARLFGVSRMPITGIALGKLWNHVTKEGT